MPSNFEIADEVLTLTFFAAFAFTLPSEVRGDMDSVARIIAGTTYLAYNLGLVRKMSRDTVVSIVQSVNPGYTPWVDAIEDALQHTFQPERQRRRPPSGGPSGHRRPPRFSNPDADDETIGETLEAMGNLSNLEFPRWVSRGVKVIDGKLIPRHVRKVCRNVRAGRSAHRLAAPAAALSPPRVFPGQVLHFAIEKMGSVNGDILFYLRAETILNGIWGESALPDHGKIRGSQRRWSCILKNFFENYRRTNAAARAQRSNAHALSRIALTRHPNSRRWCTKRRSRSTWRRTRISRVSWTRGST